MVCQSSPPVAGLPAEACVHNLSSTGPKATLSLNVLSLFMAAKPLLSPPLNWNQELAKRPREQLQSLASKAILASQGCELPRPFGTLPYTPYLLATQRSAICRQRNQSPPGAQRFSSQTSVSPVLGTIWHLPSTQDASHSGESNSRGLRCLSGP